MGKWKRCVWVEVEAPELVRGCLGSVKDEIGKEKNKKQGTMNSDQIKGQARELEGGRRRLKSAKKKG